MERAADGRILSDNVYGTIEEDAWRRDFTINALYYDIANFAVLDYVGGMTDLKAGLIRLIGDPAQHYHEDPVRLLRAVRFAAKLGFRLDPATEAPLHRLGNLLEKIPPARLFDEVLKLFLGGCAIQTFELLRHYRLFGWLFPATERCLNHQQHHYPKTLLVRALAGTDSRLAEGKPINPAFLFAALLWEPLREQMRHLETEGLDEHEALQEAAERVDSGANPPYRPAPPLQPADAGNLGIAATADASPPANGRCGCWTIPGSAPPTIFCCCAPRPTSRRRNWPTGGPGFWRWTTPAAPRPPSRRPRPKRANPAAGANRAPPARATRPFNRRPKPEPGNRSHAARAGLYRHRQQSGRPDPPGAAGVPGAEPDSRQPLRGAIAAVPHGARSADHPVSRTTSTPSPPWIPA